MTHAQTQPRRVALVVGNSSYLKLGKLKNPGNDARDVGKSLQELGFDVEILVDAGMGEMNEAVDRFGRRLVGAEAGLFFYAGHGVQSGGVNFLIPTDADVQAEYQLKYRTVAADFVLDTMNASSCELNIIILDACRDNPFSSFRSGSRGLATLASAPVGAIIVYATDPGKTASDGLSDHGTFTEAFLKHVSTPDLDVKELFDKVGSDVAAATRQQQTPWVSSKYYGTYFLAGSGPNSSTEAKTPAVQSSVPIQTIVANIQGKAELLVRTNIDGSEILANGIPLGLAGDILSIPAGFEIEIVARKGYLIGKTKLNPQSGRLYELDLELTQQKGNLLIKAKDAEAAHVYLDGKDIGVLGKGLFRDLPAGEHEFKISSKGLSGSGTVLISPDLTTTISPSFIDVGAMRALMPEDCLVVIKAEDFGPTTLGFRQTVEGIPAGVVKVSASGPGYEPAQAELTIRKGEETVWTPWTTGGLFISTSPAGANVIVNEKPAGISPLTIRNLQPGKASLVVKADGYEDRSGSALVVLGKISPAEMNLSRSTGSIRPLVKEDVSIVVENEEAGKRESIGSDPIQNLPTGNYRVYASGTGYSPTSATIQVKRNEESSWQPWETGSLRVESEPPGAIAMVGGKEAGRTPILCEDLASGELVQIQVKIEGYEDTETSREIVGGRTLGAQLTLKRSVGTLNVDIPADAEARIKNEEIGERLVMGPQTLTLPTGRYSVKAGGKGFEEASSAIIVARNQETRWCPWTTGNLRVDSEPPGAEIWVGGKYMGTGPVSLSGFYPSTLAISAKTTNYEDGYSVAAILAGKTTSVLVSLSRSQGKLRIEAPADSIITYAGFLEGRIATGSSGMATASLPVGEYILSARKGDYDPDEIKITIRKNTESTWIPWSTGSLSIESDPSGADVSVDGAPKGKTPLLLSSLALKKMNILVQAPGYEDKAIQTSPVKGHATVLPVRLERSLGTLSIIAPDDASVVVSNAEIGQRRASGADLAFDLPTGEYRLEATRPGAEPVFSSIRIERNGYQTWTPWNKAYVSISTSPAGASVFIDGTDRGLTPLVAEVEANIPHGILVKLAFHKSFSTELTAGIGKKVDVSHTMTGIPGSIVVETTPPGATVRLDDVYDSSIRTPCVLNNVEPGKHLLTILAPDLDKAYFNDENITVDVNPDETVEVKKILTRGSTEITFGSLPELDELSIDGKVIEPRILQEGLKLPKGQYEVIMKSRTGTTWRYDLYLRDYSVSINRSMMHLIVPQRTIKIDGKMNDWDGIDPVYFATNSYDPLPQNGASKISKGYVCQDSKRLYWRMDFEDGKPDYGLKVQIHSLIIQAGKYRLNMSVRNHEKQREGMLEVYASSEYDTWKIGSYAIGPSSIEMSFPFSYIKEYFNDYDVSSYMQTLVYDQASDSNKGLDRTSSQWIILSIPK